MGSLSPGATALAYPQSAGAVAQGEAAFFLVDLWEQFRGSRGLVTPLAIDCSTPHALLSYLLASRRAKDQSPEGEDAQRLH